MASNYIQPDNNDDQTNENENDNKKRFNIDSIVNLNVFKQHPKLLVRLKMNIEQHNYYEAHQAYKTLHFRCVLS